MQRIRRALSRRNLLVALAVCTLLTVQAAGLTFTVEGRSVVPNGTVVVRIAVADAQDLGGTGMIVVYDPAVLRFESAVPGSLADRARIDATETAPGRVALTVASPRSLTGSGPIAELSFAAVGASGARSPVAIEEARAVTVDGSPVEVRAVNGSVSVGGSAGTPLSPFAPAGALALAAAWFGAGRVRRRRG